MDAKRGDLRVTRPAAVPLILTHSDIQEYLRCRRVFRWSVVDDWNQPEKVTGSLALGTRVHAALEQFQRWGVDPVDTHTDLAQQARASIGENAPTWLIDQLESEILMGTNCTMAYRRWVRDTNPYDGWTVAGVERTVETPLLNGQVTLRGKIDLLLKNADGQFMIEDWKGLHVETPIPTPEGWTTMGALQPGNEVFDMHGHRCRVTAKSAVKRIGTYIVKFDDGSSVVCDTEHFWSVRSGSPVPGRNISEIPLVVRGIQEIRQTLTLHGQTHHRVPVAEPLVLPHVDLPVDPYLLGCWLGDGTSRWGEITKTASFFDHLEQIGHTLRKRRPDSRRPNVIKCTVVGLTTSLNAADLLQRKHIPDVYFRASMEQRLAMLRGLMDTDGTYNRARSRCVLSGSDKALMLQTQELMLTLGFKPHFSTLTKRGFGLVTESYELEFSATPFNPFSWQDKADRVQECSPRRIRESSRRVIVAVEEGPDVLTACISVDSPSRTYLCGRDMIPTHNTMSPTRVESAQNVVLRTFQHAIYAHTLAAQDEVDVVKARYVHMKKLKDLSRATEPVFISNVPVLRRSSRVAMGYVERIAGEILTLIDRDSPADWYPHPQDACGWCIYRQPCLLATDGRDAEDAALADQFRHGMRLSRYGT